MIPLPEPYNAHSVGQILRDPASQWSYLAIPIYTADQMLAYGAACAAEALEQAAPQLPMLLEENFTLAANQCIVVGGLCNDESGNQYCSLKRQLHFILKP